MLAFEEIPVNAFPKGLCATIGNFDGVHLGHKRLIEQARQSAAEKNLDFAVLTFWPHPREVLGPPEIHTSLSGRECRRKLLERLGTPILIELPFTPHFASITARCFIEDYLVPAGLKHLVVGYDFNFGHNREGTIDVLEELAKENSFTVEQVAPVQAGAQTVSSSHLRRLLANGEVSEAAKLLGRFYTLEGVVEHGDARGRQLGFPTANLGDISTLLPASGVYATMAHFGGQTFRAITNIGTNPTFNGQRKTVETFLLDASGDFYGQAMSLEFIKRLRDERKFPNSEALAAQIKKDIAASKSAATYIPQ